MTTEIYIITNLCDYLPDVLEICTPTQRGLREKLLDESRSDVEAHFFELLVNLSVVLVVLNELYDQSAIGQREQFCILGLIR